MLTLENVNKIANRIKNSERFNEGLMPNTVYFFDDHLTIQRYNSLYKIEFRGQVLGHILNRDSKLHDIIYDAIQEKKKELKNKAFQDL